jgi:hypothetical protein
MSAMTVLTTTVSSTQAVTLTPAVRAQLLTKLQTYAALKAQLTPIQLAMKTLADELGAIRDETGAMSLKVEGVGMITLIAGLYKKFNPKTFVANGGDLAIYTMSIDEKPKRAYNKITLVGDTDDEN